MACSRIPALFLMLLLQSRPLILVALLSLPHPPPSDLPLKSRSLSRAIRLTGHAGSSWTRKPSSHFPQPPIPPPGVPAPDSILLQTVYSIPSSPAHRAGSPGTRSHLTKTRPLSRMSTEFTSSWALLSLSPGHVAQDSLPAHKLNGPSLCKCAPFCHPPCEAYTCSLGSAVTWPQGAVPGSASPGANPRVRCAPSNRPTGVSSPASCPSRASAGASLGGSSWPPPLCDE